MEYSAVPTTRRKRAKMFYPLLLARLTPDKGRGVFACEKVYQGESLLEFAGPIVKIADVEDFMTHLQVGKETFLGSSGGIDDLVNHSCEPNCGLKVIGKRTYLVSLRDIPEGQELTFDYATSMGDNDPTEMPCKCGEIRCRGTVRNFNSLPREIQLEYLMHGVVLPHVL